MFCVGILIYICITGEIDALWNRFKPSSKIFLLTVPIGASFVDHLCYFYLVLLCFRALLFIDVLWSPAGKRLTSWLSFVMSNCEVVTFTLVSWVRCGVWLYRYLIFVLFLTLLKDTTQGRRWGSNPRFLILESSTLPLSHCAPCVYVCGWGRAA